MEFMVCRMGAIMLQPTLPIMENERSDRPCVTLKTCGFLIGNNEPNFSAQILKVGSMVASLPRKSFQTRQRGWKIRFALDTSGLPDDGGQESPSGNSLLGLGQTRLGRLVSSGARQLLGKLNSAGKNFPTKIFLVLLGFYTANALATILGQTGDWDVLVAGVVVAAIEGIGMLMYRKPPPVPTRRLQSFVGMVNYWKAGVCLGLFVDAFKLGS
ncbi:ycf20-like protein [Malania oleifera]|uniref:ycf20-like protein n=1 Tax=Malania oleifera TaxID=397392 RepID=UPI0025AE731E|nr:ycf20-like protein [Malania oleifera]XP_057963006.1 ycf20-like protein [Malania oleifera]XP_057963007.1 ycf20-like protein [Malania oleifera]